MRGTFAENHSSTPRDGKLKARPLETENLRNIGKPIHAAPQAIIAGGCTRNRMSTSNGLYTARGGSGGSSLIFDLPLVIFSYLLLVGVVGSASLKLPMLDR